MPKNKSINLLPQEEFEASTIGRVLKWATGTFRIIVIITEMVVMAAFLSRFWLDAQNSDLTDSIKIRSAQISAQGDLEKRFREIQTKLDIFKALALIPKPGDRVENVTSKTPTDVILSSMAVQENSMSIKGTASNELAIAQFASNLKNEPSFKKVELNSINSSEDNSGSTIFMIKVSY
ncbi:MAG: Fimbrial assembly family protein [Microgenomates group bacterium GW2011_GWC1_39_7b]|uniref:Fimbrial assembly family protein n=3 Tax=Candidatus Woeseibacteriota TaxID=1752722 RepID=A0A0G0P209_9BACT|nr:MAG: Fimbrial assembly family protein [Candidatus Woesebacteria bacterium GW2011_GWB1_39_10]KKR26836.1 MAG: Fimbrial assembly family protein [Microgenomates group bacterium GW2011_GWC1_39_7b]KKR73249.1 MAG: Fimbrial assembly family protein [Candidatus Woesebacteria bacterium GW2011_GWA2_40_7]KKS91074.1 MAG: Fimbrial assembly family protein [Candidatus Woesebacteria bacterium GW2011_GWA1_43_12]